MREAYHEKKWGKGCIAADRMQTGGVAGWDDGLCCAGDRRSANHSM